MREWWYKIIVGSKEEGRKVEVSEVKVAGQGTSGGERESKMVSLCGGEDLWVAVEEYRRGVEGRMERLVWSRLMERVTANLLDRGKEILVNGENDVGMMVQ